MGQYGESAESYRRCVQRQASTGVTALLGTLNHGPVSPSQPGSQPWTGGSYPEMRLPNQRYACAATLWPHWALFQEEPGLGVEVSLCHCSWQPAQVVSTLRSGTSLPQCQSPPRGDEAARVGISKPGSMHGSASGMHFWQRAWVAWVGGWCMRSKLDGTWWPQQRWGWRLRRKRAREKVVQMA